MRRNHGILFVALVVALVFSALGSASASASEWYVGGSGLTSSAPLAAKTTRVSGGIIISGGSGLEFECEGIELKSADIVPSNSGQVEHLVFTGCNDVGGNCVLSSPSIESKPLSVEAALGSKSPEDTLLLKPSAGAGTTFLEFKLEGERCALAGKKLVTGQAVFTLPKGREEAAEQLLNVHTEGELKMASFSFTLRGEVKLKLASGKNWSFH